MAEQNPATKNCPDSTPAESTPDNRKEYYFLKNLPINIPEKIFLKKSLKKIS
ncbi:hypothetical protein [Methanosarcina sp. DH2]|uniref:hypothetical protein n=1 Tax=Methanosarcina sp. DH2 TaxID=2605639 RepID=UPI001E34829D|nr:hypothetical protein [Methanosarcina sp. DH2]